MTLRTGHHVKITPWMRGYYTAKTESGDLLKDVPIEDLSPTLLLRWFKAGIVEIDECGTCHEKKYKDLLLENQSLLIKVADLQDRETVYINKLHDYEKKR